MHEFDLIETYFKKANSRHDVVLSVGDDCAVLTPPAGKDLIVTMDTLVDGAHFFANTKPFNIGYKALAVSLSDIAAMGGEPAWILLSLTMPAVDRDWLDGFCEGFYAVLHQFGLALVGGNMAKGPLVITSQVQGFVSPVAFLARKGAKEGDLIYVTGDLGLGGLAWRVLHDKRYVELFSAQEQEALETRLWQPTPRIREGQLLLNLASAAIDISDGLAGDLAHILAASNVGATINVDKLPMSPLLGRLAYDEAAYLALGAGDDYELCFTISPKHVPELLARFQGHPCPLACVGTVNAKPGLRIVNQDGPFKLPQAGYQHF